MKSFFEEYSKLIGLILLAFVVILLLSSPSLLLSKSISTIDTELSHASGDATPVRTRMDFGNNEHIRAFPYVIGDWKGTDYSSTRVAESLGADVMLLRAYWHPNSYQPVFFLIMQSKNRSSFHPPIVCYPALGYTIEEEGKESVSVQNVSWVEEPLFNLSEREKERFGCFNGTISVKKLVVVKESDGNVTERRVVLYFYVKENPIASDTVTMVRVSARIPIHGPVGSYETILNNCKELTADALPYMFEFQQEKEDIIAVSLAKSGSAGWFVIAVLLGLPLLVILYPWVKKKE